MQALVNMDGVVGHPNQAVPSSAGSTKRRQLWHCSDGRRYLFDWLILDAFPLISPTGNSTCFNSTSDFAEKVFYTY